MSILGVTQEVLSKLRKMQLAAPCNHSPMLWRCKGSATAKVIWATSGWFECCGCSGWWDSAEVDQKLCIPPWLQTVLAILTYHACSSHTQEAIQGCFACKSIWVYQRTGQSYYKTRTICCNIAQITLAWKVMKMSRNLWLLVQGFIAPWTCKVQISLGPIGIWLRLVKWSSLAKTPNAGQESFSTLCWVSFLILFVIYAF